MIILVVLLAVVVISLIIWVAVRRSKRKRALVMLQTTSKKNVGLAMTKVAATLVKKNIIQSGQPKAIPKLVADIWGRGVLAFEFSFGKTDLKKSQLEELRHQINQSIEEYAAEHHIHSDYEFPVFYVTDIWLYQENLHVDVANVINDPTREYIEDLHRVE
ncbi:hypothetical protein ADU72_0288 [Pediococcus damnosus]|uniref:Uncharacterized protein n=1 Tax=Pediococcus damnosus TaxID=51663 RepID=A0A0R2HHN0_9LACO|nr:hypothetical protein [Pediococcus damnosus]AMV59820.1 hypothetical protein ADU69_0142 [Pediococcus damnosus]AMV61888.1 hypothetical protein ADU70_0388 [Pediococcus damnosus]AMV64066.1 hypothetical protein ADU71_0143 [Pediococcus damnosus]AMV66237.1 hypothetical protein ADU72_0288 [Pediococcus damnosus]AMV68516.1 hypothetical protein ADU73_0104 [Pediococcus damnosus]